MGAQYIGSNAPFDLWFREGVNVVPVPAGLPLMVGGLTLLAVIGRTRARQRPRRSRHE